MIILLFGLVISLFNGFPIGIFIEGFGIHLPSVIIPSFVEFVFGIFLLAVPQIPLTIGNSILATKSHYQMLFPDRQPIPTKKLSLSIGGLNIIPVMLGGFPVCHGAGGLAGHYRFGARTGGALFIIGSFLIVLGVLFGNVLLQIFSLIPLTILGVLLFFAGLELMSSIRDIDFENRNDVFVLLFVAAISLGIRPFGFAIGLVGGMILAYVLRRRAIRLFE